MLDIKTCCMSVKSVVIVMPDPVFLSLFFCQKCSLVIEHGLPASAMHGPQIALSPGRYPC